MKNFVAFIHILVILALTSVNASIYISPHDFTYAPFLGLAYPIFLITALVFLLVGWLLKSKVSWINLVIIVGTVIHLNAFMGIGSNNSNDSNFSVTTFNARLFDKYEWLNKAPQTKVEIYQYLDQVDSDIYCFQEFYNENKPGNFNTLSELDKLLESKDEFHFYSHNLNNSRDFGLQIFSRLPIINDGKITFDNDPNNGVIYADIVRESDTIRIYNMHLGSVRLQNEDYDLFSEESEFKNKSKGTERIVKLLKEAYLKRAAQVSILKKHMDSCEYHIILAGDLNDTPVSYSYTELTANLEDSFLENKFGLGTTYEGKVPANRIDYILHSEELISTDFKIQEKVLSDHRAVTAYFK